MKIILIRHAKVLLVDYAKITASQMRAWVDEYNYASINTTLPSKEVISLIKDADVVVVSSLSRTNASLELIGIIPTEQNSLFNEIELPEAKGTFLKLHTKTWLIILRFMMLLRIGKNSRVFLSAKERAKRGAEHLMALAKENDSVVLIGHGGMNWLLGKVLSKSDWKCVEQSGGSNNWGYKVYEK